MFKKKKMESGSTWQRALTIVLSEAELSEWISKKRVNRNKKKKGITCNGKELTLRVVGVDLIDRDEFWISFVCYSPFLLKNANRKFVTRSVFCSWHWSLLLFWCLG